MGLLDGGLQRMFGAAFGTVLLDGRHYHKTESRVEANGDVAAPVTKVQSIKGYRETTNRRREEGASSAMRILVLQTYEGRQIDPIVRGDDVMLDGVRMTVGDIDEDPAHTHWVLTGAPA
jgi:hypothetical protein